MIIKREGGSRMPLLKRCKTISPFSPAEENLRKRKAFLEEDPEEDPEEDSCSEVSICSGEVEETPFRPLIRTSRGRLQVLPSRFSDSVLLDPRKKDKEIEEEERVKEEECVKSSTSRSTLTSLHFFASKDKIKSEKKMKVKLEVEDRFDSEEHLERRKDFYFLEDFSCGDIVWAKSGKRYPTWPATVIDPLRQAPQSVLNSCCPRALCVMFFGYSGNGQERVQNHRDFILFVQITFPLSYFLGDELGLCVGEAGIDISVCGVPGQVDFLHFVKEILSMDGMIKSENLYTGFRGRPNCTRANLATSVWR